MSLTLTDLIEPLEWHIPDDEDVQALHEAADSVGDELNAALDADPEADSVDALEQRYEDAKSAAEDAQETLEAWNAADNAFNRLAARCR